MNYLLGLNLPCGFIILGPSCVCTAEYEIKIKGVSVLAHCDDWEGDGVSWCYLAGGLDAEQCPGARKSSGGDFYWTKDTAICQAAGTKREAGKYDSKYFQLKHRP